jgi:hypothetical protein
VFRKVRHFSEHSQKFPTFAAAHLNSGMKRYIFAFLFLAGALRAQAQVPLTPQEDSIQMAELVIFEAFMRANVDYLREALDNDLVYIHVSGKQQNKKEFLKAFEGRKMEFYTMGREIFKVRMYGDFAITNGQLKTQGHLNDVPWECRVQYTGIFKRSADKKWKMLSWQATKIQ